MACQLTWSQFWVTDTQQRHTAPAEGKCCGSLEISTKILKMHDVLLHRLLSRSQCLEASFCDTLWLYSSLPPSNVPLSTVPDCARKTGLTDKNALWAGDWKVRRRWLRGPDELTHLRWGERGRNVQMKPNSPHFWMPKALESGPLFFGQVVANKSGIFKALLEQQDDVSLLWFLRYLTWEMNRISSLDNKEWGYFFFSNGDAP